MSAAERLYSTLLYAYPAAFRDEYARELTLCFADRRREIRTPAEALSVWAGAIWGILCEAPRERYHMIVHDFRHALRVLRKDAASTSAAVLILALGIGSATLVFSLANGLLLRPLPYPQIDRLVAVDEYSPTDANEYGTINFLNYLDFRERSHLLSEIGLYDAGDTSIVSPGVATIIPGARVTDGVFSALGVTPVLGRTLTRDDCAPTAPRVALISDEFWRDRFGANPAVVGKEIATANARYRIVGVMPAGFHFPDRADLWFALQTDPTKSNRTDYNRAAIARLAPRATVSAASAELESLLRQIHREHPAVSNEWHARAISYRDSLAVEYRKAVLVLLTAVGFLLLIACANVGNLLLVRASGRSRELAVRAAIGASRGRLVRQLAAESFLLGAAGGALGILLAYAGIPAFLSLIPIDLPRWMNFSIDYRVLSFAVGVAFLTSLASGLAPMFASSRIDLLRALKEGGRSGTGALQKRLRQALVVVEIALSVALLIGAGLMIRSFRALNSQALGYATDHVLSFAITYPDRAYPDGPKARALIDRLTSEFAALPGVASAAAMTERPLETTWTRIFTLEGHPVPLKDMPFVSHIVVSPGYFRTLRLPILMGRAFTDADFDAPVMIVTQSFGRRHWPGESPIGKRVRFGPPNNNEPWHTVAGVVPDSKVRGLRQVETAAVYLPYNSDITPNAFVVRTVSDPLKLASAIRARIASIDATISVNRFLTLDEVRDRAAWRERFFAVLTACFTAFAVVLSAAGFYATLAYVLTLQRREIGIRIALGASASAVRHLIARQAFRLAAFGLILGSCAAFALTRLLRSQLYQTSPTDPVAWIAALAIFAAVAALAALAPARRAELVDPVIVLRED